MAKPVKRFYIAATISQRQYLEDFSLKTVFELVDVAIMSENRDLFYRISSDFSFASLSDSAKEYIENLYKESVYVDLNAITNTDVNAHTFNKSFGIPMYEIKKEIYDFFNSEQVNCNIYDETTLLFSSVGNIEIMALSILTDIDISDRKTKKMRSVESIVRNASVRYQLQEFPYYPTNELYDKTDLIVEQFIAGHEFPIPLKETSVVDKVQNLLAIESFMREGFVQVKRFKPN